MYGEDTQVKSSTAFRAAEKQYQLHYEQILRPRKNGKLRGVGSRVKPTDLSEVLDPDTSTGDNEALKIVSLGKLQVAFLTSIPGFCLIRKGLSVEEQAFLIARCLDTFPNPPATTNYTKEHGPLPSLFKAAKLQLKLRHQGEDALETDTQKSQLKPEEQQTSNNAALNDCVSHEKNNPEITSEENEHEHQGNGAACQCESDKSYDDRNLWVNVSKGPSASSLLSKLRWASLGPNFDWTARRYLYNEPFQEVPSYLSDIAQRCYHQAMEAGAILNGDATKFPVFRPDAALVNYYSAGETLGGHSDDVESDLSKPIVSMSLGCDAIFLQGGEIRDHKPHALLVRSGDVIVLSGIARRCYHGIPRILHDVPLEEVLKHSLMQVDQDTVAFFIGRRMNVSVRETV